MAILTLAGKSLWNRRLTSALVVFAIALSVALLLGVERLRTQARTSFAHTLSGTDLVVGARGGPCADRPPGVDRCRRADLRVGYRSAPGLHRTAASGMPKRRYRAAVR